MQSLVVFELSDVEEAVLARVVRHMQAYTPVETQDEEVEVVAQTDARADSQLLEELAGTELLGIHKRVDGQIIVVAPYHTLPASRKTAP